MIKDDLKDAQKAAMRAKEKAKLATIRMILAEFKRIEVDERIDVDDARALVILDKMSKQRKESIKQFDAAGRDDLAQVEHAELAVIGTFLPEPLSDDEVASLIADAIAATGASGMADMGKVMGMLKPKLQGRADMGAVSGKIKAALT